MAKQIVTQLKNRELTGKKIKINPWWCNDQCIICKNETQYPLELIFRKFGLTNSRLNFFK